MLRCQDISHRFGSISALSGVSASFEPGRVTVVLGANGSGKSTLVRALAGVLRVDDGEITLQADPINAIAPRIRASMLAYVPQESVYGRGLRVRRMVRLGSIAGGRDADSSDRAIDALGLRDLVDRTVGSLSSGQRQRVVLARSLAQLGALDNDLKGSVIVADEPTAAMDPGRAEETLGLLREIAAHGATVIVVLHDLTLAARYADEAMLLVHGKVIRSGKVADVLGSSDLESALSARFEMVTLECGIRAPIAVGPAEASADPID